MFGDSEFAEGQHGPTTGAHWRAAQRLCMELHGVGVRRCEQRMSPTPEEAATEAWGAEEVVVDVAAQVAEEEGAQVLLVFEDAVVRASLPSRAPGRLGRAGEVPQGRSLQDVSGGEGSSREWGAGTWGTCQL